MKTWKKKHEQIEREWKQANYKHRKEREQLRDEILYLRGVLRSLSVVVRGVADGEYVDVFEVRRPTP